MTKVNKNKGFTLLEIILVIAAIGILAAIVLVAINPNRQIEAARNAKRRADINTITKAIQQYSIDNNGQYPTGIDIGAKAICKGGTPVGCVDLSNILSPTYIASIPEPDSNNYYVRRSNNSVEVSHPRDTIWNIGGTPSLDLNFAKNKSLIDGVSGNNLISFTRAETTPTANRATYVGEDGLIKTAAANEARFDHNPTTGESLGLLIEEERTNLFLRSEEFHNAILSKTQISVTANSITAPDGTLTADTVSNLAAGYAGAYHYIHQQPSVSTGIYTLSVYAKAKTGSGWIWLLGETSGNTFNYFNVNTGVTGAVPPNTLSTITPMGNGWYRCSVTFTKTSANSAEEIGFGLTLANGTQNWDSAGFANTQEVYLWGAQLEAGAFPTSYIPTTTAQVTRAADVASITGTNFSSWYNQSQGTFILNSKLLPGSGSQIGTAGETFINGSSIPNGLSIMPNYINSGAGRIEVPLNGDYSGRGISSNSLNYSNEVKMAAAIQDNNIGLSVNGVSYNSITNKIIAQDVTAMRIGASRLSSNMLDATISRLTYWPTRLPNTTLQTITQ